jgi:hypothetical protein
MRDAQRVGAHSAPRRAERPHQGPPASRKRRGAVAGGATVAPDFAAAVLARLDARGFFGADPDGTALVCSRATFERVGGIDELLEGSDGLADLAGVLRALGYVEERLPAALVSSAPAASPVDQRAQAIDASYSRAKVAVMRETGAPLSLSARREIRRAVERRWLCERGLVPDAPCAAVAYRERMGYTVGRLEPGASSHNNDARPFLAVPPPLLGKPFTQVVASRVSPVEVEFRTPGKLYVLVGTDWHGYYSATEFLRDRGFREPVAELATRRGTGFEVWSLLGEAGEALVLPTQVMLVAEELTAS